MLINQNTAIHTSKIHLVPYEKSHVPKYHEWMKDPEIQELTASEPLSLDKEYEMQASWRKDADKLTFIACVPLDYDATQDANEVSRMIGDVNLFLSEADEDNEGCIGELELMIAPVEYRGKGLGRGVILSFLGYIQKHLEGILREYGESRGNEGKKMSLLQLKVKIGSKNLASVRLFESVGFIKVGEGPNYFGEVELVLEGFLGEERVGKLLEKHGVDGYKEVEYVEEK